MDFFNKPEAPQVPKKEKPSDTKTSTNDKDKCNLLKGSKSPSKMAIERMKAVYLEPQPKPKGNATQKKFKEPEQLTQELEDAKKLIKKLQNDKIVLNTKLLRTENEVKRKEKQLEEIISNKVCDTFHLLTR